MNVYTLFIKPILFKIDPEHVHDFAIFSGNFLGKFFITKKITSFLFNYENKTLEQNILGINFKNPIGLAAGFDKNAQLTDIIPSVGFGHMEIGSITNLPCEGNPKPRLWRLKKSKGTVVNYGLANDGAKNIFERLKEKYFEIPVSTSIAMTNCKKNLDIQNAIDDYGEGFKTFTNIGSFFTVNISCPNTDGGQPFMDPINLDLLFQSLDRIHTDKPIFIKLSPDMSQKQIDDILDVVRRHRIHGIVCSNLTKNRQNDKIVDDNVSKKGGISGKPVQNISDNLLSYIFKKEKNRFILVGCGGVFNAEDAYKKIRLGASLIQMITGMIFEGPQVIGQINKDLVKFLKRDGFNNIKEAVGVDMY